MRILKNYKLSCFVFFIALTFCAFTTINTFAAQTTTTYTYDDLNRLDTVDQSDGTTYNYDYDEVGNIILKETTSDQGIGSVLAFTHC